MALVTARDFQLVPDIQGAVGQGIQTAGQLQQLQGISQARDVNEQTQLLTGQILDQSLPPAQRAEAQRQLTALNPQATQQLQQVQAGEQKALSQQDQDQLRSIAQGALQVQALPTDDAKLGFLRRRRAEIVERGGNTTETDNVINLFETGQTDIANQQIDNAVNVGVRMKFIQPKTAVGGLSNVQSSKILPGGLTQLTFKDGRVEIARLNEEDAAEVRKAEERGVKLQAARAEGRETGKLGAQLELKPEIEAAVTKARAIAADRGEVFTELNQMKAALPSLQSTVDSLRELAPIATSTLGGTVFDTVVKESGFGATKGATAKAKFIAVINNQVLPLLKPTFGAAFTVQEGESLKATMGDPDATPEAKMAQLDAFIAQKVRDIETKEAQLQPTTQGTQTLPQGITEDDIAETMRANNMTREQVLARLQGGG